MVLPFLAYSMLKNICIYTRIVVRRLAVQVVGARVVVTKAPSRT